MHFIGIDPGFTGALAVIDNQGEVVKLADTPTLTITAGRGKKTVYDIPGMAEILRQYRMINTRAGIEEAQAMPGQGVTSTFSTGLGLGVWLGILVAMDFPLTRVRPAEWKKSMKLGSDKEQSRLRAQELFPKADLRLKKYHGRAEALLLAEWLRREWMGEKHDR
jgi:hypothetical protein